MSPESLKKYLPIIEEKITRGEVMHASLIEARNKADSRATSRYDTQREIFAGDANVQEALLHRVATFREALLAGPQTTIVPGAEFDADLWDAEEELRGAIYAPVAIDLNGTPIVVADSPLGIGIAGKKAGEPFVYEISGKLLAGYIIRVQ